MIFAFDSSLRAPGLNLIGVVVVFLGKTRYSDIGSLYPGTRV